MSHIRIVSLYSGSGGNSTLVETSKGSLLIDAGKSARSLCSSLRQAGSDPGRLGAVFITHEHTDHTSALEVFLKKNPVPVHITGISADNLYIPPESRLKTFICRHTPVFTQRVADMTVTSFPVPHDSAMCVGYRIETDDGFRFGIATDTGCVTDEMLGGLSGCNAVEIESNHSVDMLRSGPYPFELKRRILSRCGHLSNDDCAVFAQKLALGGTTGFMLAHLSRENNRPDCALSAVKKALAQFPDIRLCVAGQDNETIFVNMDT